MYSCPQTWKLSINLKNIHVYILARSPIDLISEHFLTLQIILLHNYAVQVSSSRHDNTYGGYGPSRHDSQTSYSDRRSYSGDRHPTSTPFSRRDDFRRPTGPPPSRGSYRGRLGSRGARGLKPRDRPNRRRLVETSYAVRKRIISARSSDYARRLKISKMRR